MKILKGFFFTMLLASPVLAKSAPSDDYAIEEDEFLKNLELMQKKEHEFRPRPENIEEYNTDKKKGWRDEVLEFWAMLKPDTLITEVDGKKETFVVQKKVFIKVRIEKDNFAYYFILNKENKIRYKTLKTNIIPIENVANFQAAPKNFIEYGPPREYDAGDTKLQLKPYYTLHLESLSDQNEKARATRNEFKIYYGWRLPLEFGLSFSFQKGSYNQSEISSEQTVFQSFFIGPMIRYLPYRSNNLALSLEGSFQKSIGFQKSYSDTIDRYSVEAFEFGTEAIFPTFIGQLTTGLHWRLLRSSLETSTDQTHSPNSDKNGQSSFAFSVGYGREFEW